MSCRAVVIFNSLHYAFNNPKLLQQIVSTGNKIKKYFNVGIRLGITYRIWGARYVIWVTISASLNQIACRFRCTLSVSFLPKASLHKWHMYLLSPFCASMCLVRLLTCMNNFLHDRHMYRFSPLWVLLWELRLLLLANAFWHSWHLYGLSLA